MADTKISADPEVTSPADADLLPVVAGGANSKFTFASLKAYLLSGLATFTSAAKGLVPASGGGTLNFLRADGSWAVPPTGGGGGVQNNYAATSAPTTTDDSSKGYAVGSSWLVVGTGEMWRARDVTVNAARWVKVDTADHPGYVAGRRYVPFGIGAPAAGVAGVAGTTFLSGGVIKSRITLSELHIRFTTAGSGNYTLAIYANDPTKAQPTGTPIAVTASGSTATTGPMTVGFTPNVQLEPGIYWFAIQMDIGSPIYLSQGNGSTNHLALFGSSAHPIGGTASTQIAAYSIAGTYGTWPDLTNASLTEQVSRGPYIGFTVASVP